MIRTIITTVIAAMICAAASSSCVLADEVTVTESTIDESKTGSITIIKIRENDGNVKSGDGLEEDEEALYEYMEGVEFTALKAANVETLVTDGGAGTYFTDVDSGFLKLLKDNGIEIESIKQGGKDHYTTESLTKALAGINSTEGDKPGAALLTEYIKNSSSAVKFEKTDSAGRAVLSDLPLGLYIIAETDSSGYVPKGEDDALEMIAEKTVPFFVSVPMTNRSNIEDGNAGTLWQYDVTVYPKNQTLSVKKYIVSEDDKDTLQLTEDAECGEIVSQVMISDIPVLAGSGFEKYEVADIMEEGLEYKSVLSVKISGNADEAKKLSQFKDGETLIPEEDYEIEVSDDRKSFTVKMKERGLTKMNSLAEGSRLVVSFDTYVTRSVKDSDPSGVSNRPELTVKSRTAEEIKVTGNEPVVYSYRLKIEKKGLTDPGSAAFKAVRESTGETMSFVEESDGVYHVFDRSEDTAAGSTSLDEISPDSEGYVVIRGLDSDTYEFSETATQSGYDLLSSSFKVVIKGNDPSDGNIADAKVNSGEDTAALNVEGGTAYLTLENHPSIELRTGGSGRKALYTGGGAVFLAAVLMSIKKKKKAHISGNNE